MSRWTSKPPVIDDWEFSLGQDVVVGDQVGRIMGQRTHVFQPDSYDIQIINNDGLPEERCFPGYAVVKQRNLP